MPLSARLAPRRCPVLGGQRDGGLHEIELNLARLDHEEIAGYALRLLGFDESSLGSG